MDVISVKVSTEFRRFIKFSETYSSVGRKDRRWMLHWAKFSILYLMEKTTTCPFGMIIKLSPQGSKPVVKKSS